MEENVINKADFEAFKEEVRLFRQLNEPMTATKINPVELSDYLKWCEVRKINKLIEITSSKS